MQFEASREWPDLTSRQQDVLAQLLRGLSEQEAATRLHISPHTVHNHVKALYKAFVVSSRLELLSHCIDLSKAMASLGASGGPPPAPDENDLGHLSESERNARRILGNTPDFILEFDAQGTIRFINRVYPFHAREDVEGSNAIDWLSPADLERFMGVLAEAFGTGRPQQCTLNIPGMSEDGTRRIVQARLSRVDGEAGAERVIVVARIVEE